MQAFRNWAASKRAILAIVASITFALQAPQTARAELLAHWTFDDITGSIAPDSSGKGNDGELIAGPVAYPAGGQIGDALILDGREEYVSVPGLLSEATAFTVAGWVVPSGSLGSLLKTDQNGLRFWVDTRTGDKNRYALQLIADSSGVYVKSEWLHYQDGALHSNRWNHVAATWNGETVRLYANGNLQEETAFAQEKLKSMDSMGIGQ